MIDRLPVITARQLVKALERGGFAVQRQKGSHITMRHPVTRFTTVVPMHTGDMKRPLLKMILKQANLNDEDLRALLQ